MRIVLKLKASKEKEFPYNYNSLLSEEISRMFLFNSPEMLEFLQSKNYKYADRPFRMFSFALHFENVLHRANRLMLRSNNATLCISFNYVDEFVKQRVLDNLEGKEFTIPGKHPNALFTIQSAVIKPSPVFSGRMEFSLKSPLIVSTRRKIKNIPTNFYLTYKDNTADISRILSEDLRRKYQLIYDTELHGSSVKLEWDEYLIEERLKTKKKLSAKLTLDVNHKRSVVVGNIIPFRLTGDSKLLTVGYENGFGFLNYLGFGLADLIE